MALIRSTQLGSWVSEQGACLGAGASQAAWLRVPCEPGAAVVPGSHLHSMSSADVLSTR